jgi:hypothetical protein
MAILLLGRVFAPAPGSEPRLTARFTRHAILGRIDLLAETK